MRDGKSGSLFFKEEIHRFVASSYGPRGQQK